MIGVDTNLLVYAHREDSPWHERAEQHITELAEARAPWAIPWPCVHEFYSVATHPRVYNPPSTRDEAFTQIEAWMRSPSLVLLAETSAYWSTLRGLVTTGQVVGPRIHDARIAALCLTHGVTELWSADRDFSRFPGLRVRNPLIA
jgi:toxin-antitoxin system PIN domain toxin